MVRVLVIGLLAGMIGFVVGVQMSGGQSGDEGFTAAVRGLVTDARHTAMKGASGVLDVDMRMRVLLEHPELIDHIGKTGGFGGEFSRSIAQNMFGRLDESIDDALEKSWIEEVSPRTWLIHMPIVNAALFETDEGLVLVDVGMAPAGPAIVELMKSVSDKPLHTLVYTHGHVDHAYGAWALAPGGYTPQQVVAHEDIVPRFERYIALRGSLADYMSQPRSQLPASREDFVWPTQTFRDRLELEIGGETFVLQHHRGETDDQLYVWVPGRRALASADYYQGFLPNAGNGKRVQRHVGEWIVALREMADLEPLVLLPAHGEAMTGTAPIQESFRLLADALEHIRDHTLAGLNRGLRKDQIFQSLDWPDRFANDPRLNIQYVTPMDISKMVIKRYTGWWDDIPSHWTPAPLVDQAQAIAALAGGVDQLASVARETAKTDIQLACHLADWAYYADPSSPLAQQLIIDVYKQRILDPASNTQEILAYVDHMTEARAGQLNPDELPDDLKRSAP
jgi:glyoxylase-like metal-dependent hydrolase (beta-lactamase superfamily II)